MPDKSVDKAPAKAAEPQRSPVSGEKDFDPTTQPGFQEFPKMITTPGGLQIVVGSKEEEDEKMKTGTT